MKKILYRKEQMFGDDVFRYYGIGPICFLSVILITICGVTNQLIDIMSNSNVRIIQSDVLSSRTVMVRTVIGGKVYWW